MIQVNLVLAGGLLKSCEARGHAKAGPKGADIVCAAVSVLARSAYGALSGRKGISVRADFSERGEFSLEVLDGAEQAGFVSGITAFLCEGLVSVSREYPDNCIVRIAEE